MSLQCELVVDDDVRFDRGDAVADLLQHAALSEERTAKGRWSMSLRLSSDATIADLHARFFDDPTPTDVISFPSGDEPVEGHGVREGPRPLGDERDEALAQRDDLAHRAASAFTA